MYPHLPVPECRFLGTFPELKELPGGILGVDAGGPEQWRTFWFRWDGSQWVDITPEEPCPDPLWWQGLAVGIGPAPISGTHVRCP
jgi:hypothetical protein